jgi:hypothetical protein
MAVSLHPVCWWDWCAHCHYQGEDEVNRIIFTWKDIRYDKKEHLQVLYENNKRMVVLSVSAFSIEDPLNRTIWLHERFVSPVVAHWHNESGDPNYLIYHPVGEFQNWKTVLKHYRPAAYRFVDCVWGPEEDEAKFEIIFKELERQAIFNTEHPDLASKIGC